MNLHQQQQQQQLHHQQQQQQQHHHQQQQQQQQHHKTNESKQNNNLTRADLPLKKSITVTGTATVTGTTLYPITITQISNAQKCVHPNKNYINNNKSNIMAITTTSASISTSAPATTIAATANVATTTTVAATTTTTTNLKRKHSVSPAPPLAPPLARSPSPDGTQDYDVTRMREEDFERLAVYLVPDVQCERGIPNRADKTLPRSLTLKPSMVYSTPNVKTEGVWSTGVIPRGTRFGPFEGVPTPNYPNDKNTARYFWRVSMVTAHMYSSTSSNISTTKQERNM